MASPRHSNIQDFVQEVLVGQRVRVPLSVPAVAHPPPPILKVLGGGKGEVKPSVQHATQGSDTYIYI